MIGLVARNAWGGWPRAFKLGYHVGRLVTGPREWRCPNQGFVASLQLLVALVGRHGVNRDSAGVNSPFHYKDWPTRGTANPSVT